MRNRVARVHEARVVEVIRRRLVQRALLRAARRGRRALRAAGAAVVECSLAPTCAAAEQQLQHVGARDVALRGAQSGRREREPVRFPRGLALCLELVLRLERRRTRGASATRAPRCRRAPAARNAAASVFCAPRPKAPSRTARRAPESACCCRSAIARRRRPRAAAARRPRRHRRLVDESARVRVDARRATTCAGAVSRADCGAQRRSGAHWYASRWRAGPPGSARTSESGSEALEVRGAAIQRYWNDFNRINEK